MASAEIPWFVRVVDPLARSLLRLGVPMGPNTLLTVRGRKSGQPRTAAVAVAEIEGRRWVIGGYGVVNWVRNLRAAGEGTLRKGRRSQHVVARELGTAEAAAFFQDVLAPDVAGLPWIGRMWVPDVRLPDLEDSPGYHITGLLPIHVSDRGEDVGGYGGEGDRGGEELFLGVEVVVDERRVDFSFGGDSPDGRLFVSVGGELSPSGRKDHIRGGRSSRSSTTAHVRRSVAHSDLPDDGWFA